jgi:hypothetical protein
MSMTFFAVAFFAMKKVEKPLGHFIFCEIGKAFFDSVRPFAKKTDVLSMLHHIIWMRGVF